MWNELIECVPNVSEGRDRQKIDAIVQAVAEVPGCLVLHVDAGYDANRTVITFVGSAGSVLEGAYRLIRRSSQLIDMRLQRGKHPRLGAADVCPLVPVRGVTLEKCVELARALGERVARELGIPVYLYEYAATAPHRRLLASIRSGEYEGLSAKMLLPEWRPDFGKEFHAGAGAVVIGARQFLIAYNVNLNTRDAKIAKEIAGRVRESGSRGKPGLLRTCRAIGWYMEEYGCAQVSMNLTDYHVTGLHEAFSACCEEAVRLGTKVTGSELIGLVPEEALLQTGRILSENDEQSTDVLLERAIVYLGLSEFKPFKVEERVLERIFEKLTRREP